MRRALALGLYLGWWAQAAEAVPAAEVVGMIPGRDTPLVALTSKVTLRFLIWLMMLCTWAAFAGKQVTRALRPDHLMSSLLTPAGPSALTTRSSNPPLLLRLLHTSASNNRTREKVGRVVTRCMFYQAYVSLAIGLNARTPRGESVRRCE